jgi:hypothetical protein
MVRGLNYSWKQPISYYLISKNCCGRELNDIIFQQYADLEISALL